MNMHHAERRTQTLCCLRAVKKVESSRIKTCPGDEVRVRCAGLSQPVAVTRHSHSTRCVWRHGQRVARGRQFMASSWSKARISLTQPPHVHSPTRGSTPARLRWRCSDELRVRRERVHDVSVLLLREGELLLLAGKVERLDLLPESLVRLVGRSLVRIDLVHCLH